MFFFFFPAAPWTAGGLRLCGWRADDPEEEEKKTPCSLLSRVTPLTPPALRAADFLSFRFSLLATDTQCQWTSIISLIYRYRFYNIDDFQGGSVKLCLT